MKQLQFRHLFHPLRPEHSSFASFFLAIVACHCLHQLFILAANCTCICIEPVVKKFVKRLTYVNVVGTFGSACTRTT